MWCKSCKQDVPAVAAAGDASQVCCPRCNSTLSLSASVTSRDPNDTVGSGKAEPVELESELDEDQGTSRGVQETNPPSLEFCDWQFQDDARAIQRILGSLGNKPHWRLDTAHDAGSHDAARAPHSSPTFSQERPVVPSSRSPQQKPKGQKKSGGKTSWFSWLLMAVGLMTFVCGAVLLGRWFHDGQEQLWRLGLPLTLGGQVALLFGLVVQLEALWKNSRGTSVTLDELDQQIDQLRQTTAVMNNASTGAAKSFYVHMAEDASPQVLLADLKGQLDVLAVKMAKQRDGTQ